MPFTLKHILLWGLELLLVILLGMGGVAFITLLERKVLGLSQIRLGPNKVTFFGLLQPVADGVKLLTKQLFMSLFSQSFVYMLGPFLLLLVFISLWSFVVCWPGVLVLTKYSSLLLFSLLGVSAYSVILVGWSIMSSFSKLGSLRGILQSLSYEVSLILVFMILLTMMNTLFAKTLLSIELAWLWLVIWVLLSLMESNRAPFDLLEGESELISGFNIEMGSLMFVYLFLSEYGMIIVMALISNLIILNKVGALCFLVSFTILLIRSCYPRVRYDAMMSLMWQSVLPISLFLFLISGILK